MITLPAIMRSSKQLLVRYSPQVLTSAGVIGVVGTAWLTYRATPLALDTIRFTETAEDRELSIQEKVKLTYRIFAPAVVTGCLTIACIVASNQVSEKRIAALGAAYDFSQRAYKTYREQAKDVFGKEADRKISDSVAQRQVDENPPTICDTVPGTLGDQLCYDSFTGRYFRGDMEGIRSAINKINQRLINESWVSLNDYFDEIGLERTGIGDSMGWNCDNMVDIQFSSTLSPEGTPCLVATFLVDPRTDYYKFG